MPATYGNQYAVNDAFSGLSFLAENSSLTGVLPVLANDPRGSSVYSVYATQPNMTTTPPHRGSASIPINYEGSTYYGTVSTSTHGVSINFSTLNGRIDSLAAGETISTSFWYVARMSNGALSPAQVTATFVGVNDAASISGISTGSINEGATAPISGDLDVFDIDHGQSSFRSPPSLAGQYGTFTFDTFSGAWSYTLNNSSPALADLDTGETLVDSLTVRSADGTASRTINVTINGADEANVAFITGPTNPWGEDRYDLSMNVAFGVDGWAKFNDTTYENIFDDGFEFIWIDGGDGQGPWFQTYVDLYRDAMEDYVAAGGTLLINAARWEGSAFDLGFGVTLTQDYSGAAFATAAGLATTITTGPNGATGSSWTGGSFSHDSVAGTGLVALITDDNGDTVLGDMSWGAGHVAFGGMTSAVFHEPYPEVDYLEANILDYVYSFYDSTVVI